LNMRAPFWPSARVAAEGTLSAEQANKRGD
jgi:hypothetical protein